MVGEFEGLGSFVWGGGAEGGEKMGGVTSEGVHGGTIVFWETVVAGC